MKYSDIITRKEGGVTLKRILILLFFVAMIILLVPSCASSVSRVSSDKVLDISGEWNETDVQIVSESLIADCLNSVTLARFSIDHDGRLPVLKVGAFKNQSQEHIDTSIITTKLRNAIINSGRAQFVAAASAIAEVRSEKESQQEWASWDSAKSLANETAADYMLQGSIKTIVQKNGKTTVRTYYVYAELVDIETGRIVWTGENEEIKKLVKSSSVRF